MENSRIIELMAKKMDKSASPEELEALIRLLTNHPEHAYFHEVVHALKGNQDHLELITPKEELEDHGWRDLAGKLNEGRAGTGLVRRMGGVVRRVAAAVFLGIVVAGVALYNRKAPVQPAGVNTALQVGYAGLGATRQLVLSDGTRVWLNAGSKLTYPATFPNDRREVKLEGEAYFEVAKGSRAPFSVHAGKITVGVLGTSFNVKAYSGDKDIETTLITGKVQVTLDNEPEKPILLSPHEKLTIVNEMESVPEERPAGKGGAALKMAYNALRYKVQALPRSDSNNVIETAWLNNKLVVNDESFETVAHMLERKYDVSIHFEDERLMQEHISGVFEKESIEEVLHILKMTTGFNYKMEGKIIYIRKN
ncbi:MAG TPA: FecR domain-containing protein [Puia sp.]|nr:FecR domain-containing protein [Puia sp.]